MDLPGDGRGHRPSPWRVIHAYPTQAEAIKQAARALRGRGGTFRRWLLRKWVDR
jgi:hypothetical protein